MSSDTVFIVIFTSFASSPSSISDPFCFTIPSLVIDDHFNVLIDFEFCGSYDIFAKKFVALDEASETTRVVSITEISFDFEFSSSFSGENRDP